MIIDENVCGFIRSFEPDLEECLSAIEKKSLIDGVPIIRKEAQSLLRFLIKLSAPKRILEIGTAVGFSACLMAEYMPEDAKIVSIEKDKERYCTALNNIEKCGRMSQIKVINGDAAEVLKKLSDGGDCFDFVFLDAAKAQYGIYSEYITKMLKNGGILLTDNILQEGSVAVSKFAVPRRERTIHVRMREFVSSMMKSKQYSSVIVPLGDGMLVSAKLERMENSGFWEKTDSSAETGRKGETLNEKT